jgi:hypothetical protein
MVPGVGVGLWLYRVAGRGTGGPQFRAAVRVDIARGVAAAHRVVAVDAIEVEEQEDEGPTYFLLTDDGKTMVFSGQYLESYKRKGFPWTTFEILEGPESKVFFGLVPDGARLAPSLRRGPLSWEEYKQFVSGSRNYAILDVAFDALKARMTNVRRIQSVDSGVQSGG